MSILKTIIPAAGLDTKFLPVSTAIPKEMLPLGNKPAIHYLIDEAIASGIHQFTFITNKHKHAIIDYLDRDRTLEAKHALLDPESSKDSQRLHRLAQFSYVTQPEPLGTGHALLRAQNLIGKEYFSVMYPDDIIVSKQPALAQLMRIAQVEKGSVIAVQEVPRSCVDSYGIIEIKKQLSPSLFQVGSITEKPEPKNAPSSLALVGRFILSPKIFAVLEEMERETEEPLDLSAAISRMIYKNEKVFAVKLQGKRYDIGTPLGWTKAVIGLALEHPIQGPIIKKYIQDMQTPESFMFNPIKNIEHTL